MMNDIKIFKNDKLPFIELRYIKNIKECEKLHSHNEITITSIKENSININLKDKSIFLEPNQFLIINRLITHSATLETDAKHGYVLYLDNLYLNNIGFFFNDDYFYIKNNHHFIKLCEVILDKNISIIQKEEFFLEFCMKFFNYKNTKKFVVSNLAYKIKNYLDKNFLEDIVLEDISKEFDITVVHLIRVFKKQFGLAIHSYIINKKVHKAKELLNSNLPIIEVALQSGFFDQSHLNRSFKRVFQITPKQFQKNILS
ncbi:AraC family transcriptional regulator [Malaciobacter molluscorum LMG 25693]|uniref:AraC family transcriptional regulator n=2 Tax=Malaciobacter molluscorum LMG 25693 TaxID=870501 RepID=A0A2G1DIH5_9BACT|nr:AraC family transcriptional regulator [Malaciobacter molluscorum LMG 25693]